MSMIHMVLDYKGKEIPPEIDMKIIESSGVNNIRQRSPGVIEFESFLETAQKLQDVLPNWELSLVGHYGIPELESFDRLSTSHRIPKTSVNNLEADSLVEIASSIREYLISRENKSKLANVISALTDKKTKWQHIMKAIENTSDIQEDGQFVWINN